MLLGPWWDALSESRLDGPNSLLPNCGILWIHLSWTDSDDFCKLPLQDIGKEDLQQENTNQTSRRDLTVTPIIRSWLSLSLNMEGELFVLSVAIHKQAIRFIESVLEFILHMSLLSFCPPHLSCSVDFSNPFSLIGSYIFLLKASKVFVSTTSGRSEFHILTTVWRKKHLYFPVWFICCLFMVPSNGKTNKWKHSIHIYLLIPFRKPRSEETTFFSWFELVVCKSSLSNPLSKKVSKIHHDRKSRYK